MLAFLTTALIGELAAASQTLRTVACTCLEHLNWQWRLVSPHLQLTTRLVGAALQKVWLPHTRWLEAQELNPKACRVLCAALERTGVKAVKSLVSLDLRNTKVENAQALAKVVRACQGLEVLHLGRAKLKDSADLIMRAFLFDPVTGVKSPHRQLRVLGLEENSLTSLAGNLLADTIRCLPLQELLLARNELGDDGAKAIAEAILEGSCGWEGYGSCLTRLDLSENRIAAVGLAALFGALCDNRSLQSLDLGGNEQIGVGLASSSQCFQEVALSLGAATGLRDLHMWRCGLSDAACVMVVEAQPPQLTLLNLAANPFSASLRTRLLSLSNASSGGVIRV